jgi:hypothetical protein
MSTHQWKLPAHDSEIQQLQKRFLYINRATTKQSLMLWEYPLDYVFGILLPWLYTNQYDHRSWLAPAVPSSRTQDGIPRGSQEKVTVTG